MDRDFIPILIFIVLVIGSVVKKAWDTMQENRQGGGPKPTTREQLPEATRRTIYGPPGVRQAKPARRDMYDEEDEEDDEGEGRPALEDSSSEEGEAAEEVRPAIPVRPVPRVPSPVQRPAAPRPVAQPRRARPVVFTPKEQRRPEPPVTVPFDLEELRRMLTGEAPVRPRPSPAPPKPAAPPPKKVKPPARVQAQQPAPSKSRRRPERRSVIAALLSSRNDLRRGILLHEILGPPKGLR
ncbi:MAG: hypothetical protein HY706_10835 [Candidatus Hydrogenedentes bacterium]|nr:hypothetical protein [Candidatus Hydrogenedentota bacterium]